MLKTIRIDKQLLAEAQKATGIHAPDELIHAGLKALIKKGAAEELAIWIATRPTIESILGDRLDTEPIEVAQELRAAYEAAIEGDMTRAAGIEELRQFDLGTHPAQHSQAAHHIWLLTKIQAGLNDPRPPSDGEVFMKRLISRLESRRVSSGGQNSSDDDDDPSRTTVEVEAELLNEADDYMLVESDSELVNAALSLLISSEAVP